MSAHTKSSQGSVFLPLWLKSLCILAALGILLFLSYRYAKKSGILKTSKNGSQKSEIRKPETYGTTWPDIKIRIDGIVRVDHQTIIAEWAYVNENENPTASFSWGFSQPNYVSFSQIIDAKDKEYPVVMLENGDLVCADTNRFDQSGWSKQIFGGRDLPVWAKFTVPKNAPKPLKLRLFGLDNNGQSEVKIKLLKVKDQYIRAYQPKLTNWPNIFVQLLEVTRRDPRTIEVKWKYMNKSKSDRFIWGVNRPNYVAHSQVYDYSTGRYKNVARKNLDGKVLLMCSSTNKDDGSGWSHSLEPGSELEAKAVFEDVKGDNIQILFHSAMPLFYDPERTEKPPIRTN